MKINNKTFFLLISLFSILFSIITSTEVKSALTKSSVKQDQVLIKANWFPTNFQAIDLGVGAEGDVVAVGTDGRVYNYNFSANSYTVIDGDYEMININRVDVDDQGTPYIVGSCGGVFYLSCFNNWVQLPGCGIDIGVGRGQEVWKIGCDSKGLLRQDYGIWKLFCKCEGSFDCERGCIRFRPSKYINNPNGDKRKCYWNRIEGSGTRIDVHPNGNPYILNNRGRIFKYDSETFNLVGLNGVLARDITICNEGLLYAVGKTDNRIYRALDEENGSWTALQGCANEISCAPYAQPWIVGCDTNIGTTSKLQFN